MAFPRFTELPLELQDLVWEFCIPNAPPAAHVAHLLKNGVQNPERSEWGKPLQGEQEPSLMRSCTPEAATEPYLNLDRPIALQILLKTTSRSRAVALRHVDALAPIVPAILAGEDTAMRSCTPEVETEPDLDLDPIALQALLRMTSRSRAVVHRDVDEPAPIVATILPGGDTAASNEAQTGVPELRINAATDLVILEEGWYRELKSVHGMTLYHLQCPEPLHYLAFPYSGWQEELDRGLNALLSAYHKLKVLYILIEPDELLRASEQPWVEYEEPEWSGEEEFSDDVGLGDDDVVSLDAYLATYVEGSIRPGPFRCGRREYFEVPAEQIRSLGGLQSLIEDLEKKRALRARTSDGHLADNMIAMAEGKPDAAEGSEPMRFRLLSWRDV